VSEAKQQSRSSGIGLKDVAAEFCGYTGLGAGVFRMLVDHDHARGN
jgi:hypothetical protein